VTWYKVSLGIYTEVGEKVLYQANNNRWGIKLHFNWFEKEKERIDFNDITIKQKGKRECLTALFKYYK